MRPTARPRTNRRRRARPWSGSVLRHSTVAAQLVRRPRLRGPRHRGRGRPGRRAQHDVRTPHRCRHHLRRRRWDRAGDAADRQALRHHADPLVPPARRPRRRALGQPRRSGNGDAARLDPAVARLPGEDVEGDAPVPAAPRTPARAGPEHRPMRVLFTTQPGTGHLHPLLPIAAGMRRRGHEVAFASSASFAAEIGGAGFDAFAVGRDWLTVDMLGAFPEMISRPPGPGRYAWARSAIFAGETASASVPDLLAVGDAWRPDLIVRDAAEYGGCVAAELLGVPHAVVRTDSGSSSYSERQHVGSSLSELRAESGCRPTRPSRCPFDISSCRSRRPVSTSPTTWRRRPATTSDRSISPPTVQTCPRPGSPSSATSDGVRHARHRLQRARAARHDHRRPGDGGRQRRRDGRRHAGPGSLRPASAQRPHRALDPSAARAAALRRRGHPRGIRHALGDAERRTAGRLHPDLRRPTAERRAVCRPRRRADRPSRRTNSRRRSLRHPGGAHRPPVPSAAERVASESRRRPGLDHAMGLLEALGRDREPLVASRPPAPVGTGSIAR